MDVGSPNNFPRALELFDNSWDKISKKVHSYSFDDEQTKKEIKRVFDEYNYVVDPHTAVGFLGFEKFKENNPDSASVILATAHAAKFLETMNQVLPKDSIERPNDVDELMSREKVAKEMSADYGNFKQFLVDL